MTWRFIPRSNHLAKAQGARNALQERAEVERDRFVYQAIEEVLSEAGREAKEPSEGVKPLRPILPEIAEEKTKKRTKNKVKPEETPGGRTPGKVFQDLLKDGTKGPEMVVIPAGRFQMGDLDGTGSDNENPVHWVNIEKPFALGKYPVTFEEYDRFAKATKHGLPADGRGWVSELGVLEGMGPGEPTGDQRFLGGCRRLYEMAFKTNRNGLSVAIRGRVEVCGAGGDTDGLLVGG